MQQVIWYFYTLWNNHQDKSSFHLSQYKVIKILLTIIPMLCTISPWWKFIPLNHCLFHPNLLTLPSPHLNRFVLCIYGFVFVLFAFLLDYIYIYIYIYIYVYYTDIHTYIHIIPGECSGSSLTCWQTYFLLVQPRCSLNCYFVFAFRVGKFVHGPLSDIHPYCRVPCWGWDSPRLHASVYPTHLCVVLLLSIVRKLFSQSSVLLYLFIFLIYLF